MATGSHFSSPTVGTGGVAPPGRSGSRRTGVWVAVTAGVIVVAAAAVWLATRGSRPEPGGDPIEIAQFVATEDFDRLPEPDKRAYMARLRENVDALKSARSAGRLSEDEYRLASYYAWLERKLDRVDDYFDEPSGKARQRYLDELLQKRQAKQKTSPGTAGQGQPQQASAAVPAQSGAKAVDDDEDDRDRWLEERMKRWTAEERTRWEEFDDAFDARAKARGL